MKRFFAIILSALILTSFAACNNDSGTETNASKVESGITSSASDSESRSSSSSENKTSSETNSGSSESTSSGSNSSETTSSSEISDTISFQMQLWQKMQELCSKMAYIISL